MSIPTIKPDSGNHPPAQNLTVQKSSAVESTYLPQIEDIEKKPRRPQSIHWGAFILSLISLVLLIVWIINSQISTLIVWIDTGISVLFFIEFFTRSGFRWNPVSYMLTHVFDFIATVPALLLAYYGVAFEGIWIWIILAARCVRSVDRLLGDGFMRRNVLALVEGFEEEIADRVTLRILTRVQADLDRTSFANLISEVLERNRDAVLGNIRSKYPQRGIVVGLARAVKLDSAIERVELAAYKVVVDIVRSTEVDKAIRDVITSIFNNIKAEIGVKTWRKHLGIKR